MHQAMWEQFSKALCSLRDTHKLKRNGSEDACAERITGVSSFHTCIPLRYSKTRWRSYAFAYTNIYNSAFSLDIQYKPKNLAKPIVLLVLVLSFVFYSSSPSCACVSACVVGVLTTFMLMS